jgi:squalene-hopene/tetraprenyl-beta-curcumene cyclase
MLRAAPRLFAFALVAGLTACGEEAPKTGGTPPTPSATPSAPPASAGGYGYAANLGADLDKKAGDALAKGRAFMLSKRDAGTGAFDAEGPTSAGYSAFGALALIAATRRESVGDDPTIGKTLEYVASFQKPEGGIWENDGYRNYETAVAVSAFAAARVSRFREMQQKAREYLVSTQVSGDPSNLSYGGFPYRSKSDPTRPTDLSNAQFAATALHDADLPKEHAAWKLLLSYTEKVHNRTETNKTTVKRTDKELGEIEIVSGNDGGAGYAPGVSMAGLVKRADGRYELRSYGSMTYALLKCYLFAGLSPDDPRVRAAYDWISKHFTVERNPGFEQGKDPAKEGKQGYFYYLLTMSRALAEHERATGKPAAVTDADGKAHDWRKEVASVVVSLQREDGSWVNDVAERWEEGNPLLATSYAMQTLAICQGRLP